MGMSMIIARGAYGPVVERIQSKLGIKPDMDFGPATERAVSAWQLSKGVATTGELNERSWLALTGEPEPSLFERCLGITMGMESHGWSNPKGNFDGAKITAGIIGFNVKSGSLLRVLRLAGYGLQPVTLSYYPEQISAEVKEWLDTVLTSHAGRQAQMAITKDDYWLPSQESAAACGFKSDAHCALCFDVHVQCPPISPDQRIKLAAIEDVDIRARALVEMKAVGTWAQDVRSRKMIFVTGSGTVHGRKFDLRSSGLA